MRIPTGRLKLTVASGTILLALVLHFFVAISLPFIQPLYIVETSFNSNNSKQEVAIGSSQKLTQIRLGIWGACYYWQDNSACFKAASAYNVTITENKSRITVVEPSWTGGLPLQVFAGGFTLVAFVLAHFFPHYRFVTLIAVGVAGGASLLGLLIEVALFLLVKGKMQTLGAGATTNPGPGFWMTLIPTLLLGGVGAVFLWLFFKDKPSRMEDKKEEVDSTVQVTHPKTFNPFISQLEQGHQTPQWLRPPLQPPEQGLQIPQPETPQQPSQQVFPPETPPQQPQQPPPPYASQPTTYPARLARFSPNAQS